MRKRASQSSRRTVAANRRGPGRPGPCPHRLAPRRWRRPRLHRRRPQLRSPLLRLLLDPFFTLDQTRRLGEARFLDIFTKRSALRST